MISISNTKTKIGNIINYNFQYSTHYVNFYAILKNYSNHLIIVLPFYRKQNCSLNFKMKNISDKELTLINLEQWEKTLQHF